jgi:hypothetical protein
MEEDTMAPIISFVVQWVITPIVMIGFLVFSFSVIKTLRKSDVRVSARAGTWAGFLISVIYVTCQMDLSQPPEFKLEVLPDMLYIPILIGFAFGFLFLWLARILARTHVVGVVTLLLTTLSISGLFTYFCIESYRIYVLYGVLGVALGALLHVILFPISVRIIFNRVDNAK